MAITDFEPHSPDDPVPLPGLSSASGAGVVFEGLCVVGVWVGVKGWVR